MNKINIKFHVLLFILITFLSGCPNLVEVAVDSSSSAKKETIRTSSKQNSPKLANDVQIFFSLVDSQIVLNQPVLLKFVLLNGLGQTVRLDLGQNFKENFLFTLVFPDGKRSHLRQLTRDGFSIKGIVTVEPQKVYSQELLLNEWGEFNMVGDYVLEGRLKTPIETTDGKPVEIASDFSIGFTLESENAEHLKKVSETLYKRLTDSKTYAEAAETALALSYVKNSVAVQYLQKALTSNKMVESVIINSLRERGGKESVEVLIGAMNEKPNSEMEVQARSALSWIAAHTSDATVKARIIQALNQ